MSDSSAAITQQAIQAALSANWETALSLNQQILEENPNSVEALNRMGRAHFELGNLSKAKKYFDSALQVDPYNQIAAKFLKRIGTFRKKGADTLQKQQKAAGQLKNVLTCLSPLSIDSFIEEPGITKLISLLKVAEPQKLSLLSPGASVNLVKKNHCISVTDQVGEYLGVLPDDLSHHLLRLINGGNKYQAHIKTIKTTSLSILIREIFRSAKFRNQPSFLDNLNFASNYSSSNLILTGENEEDPPYEADGEEEVV